MELKTKDKLEEANRRFMQGVDITTEKSKREAFRESLRKEQRQKKANENRMKLRYRREEMDQEADLQSLRRSEADLSALVPSLSSPSLTPESRLNLYISVLNSPALPSETRHSLLSYLRTYLTTYNPYPGESMFLPMEIDPSLIPVLISNLNPEAFGPETATEAAAVLNCLLSDGNDMVSSVITHSGIPAILRLIHSQTTEAAEHAIWAIGNIANESAEYRNAVIAAGADRVISQFVIAAEIMTVAVTQTTAWTLGQLLRGKPAPPFDTLKTVLRALQVLLAIDDTNTKCEVMEAISKYSAWDSSLCDELSSTEMLSFALHCVSEDDSPIVPHALSILGSVVENDDLVASQLVSSGLLDALERWVDDPNSSIRKEVAWIVSNLAAGECSQVDILSNHSIFAKVVLLLEDPQSTVRAEASWLCRHVAMYGSRAARERIVRIGAVNLLKKTLYDTSDTTYNTLLTLKSLFEQASEAEQRVMASTMHGNSSFQYIEKLMQHRNDEVGRAAEELVDLVTDGGTGFRGPPQRSALA